MSGTFGRIAKSFLVNLLLMVIVIGVVFLMIQGVSSLDPTVRAGLTPRRQEARVADMRTLMLMWCLVAFLISWIASSLFLAVAERTLPSHVAEARSRMTLWTILLFTTIALLALTCWLILFQGRTGISEYITFENWGPVLIVSIVLSLISYYLATGLAVKTSMRPSVPLGEAFPRFWSN